MGLQKLADRRRNRGSRAPNKPSRTVASANSHRLTVEGLEPRLLLYAVNGGVWPHPELVTVSFMPDGTDIGGMPNSLISTFNAKWPTSTWQKEVLEGPQSFAANANINFSVASDDGSPFGSCGGSGSDCNMQGDSNFGDIRIGGFDLAGPLGISMLPPPLNGDTQAGDFFLNTTATWNIGASFDLYTVSAHEAGHSVGLDHSLDLNAVMYATYTSVKSALTADDIAGIKSIYGARPQDSFDASAPNNVKADATVITSYIDSNKQITLNGLDVTTNSDADWYKVTVPSGNSGTMTVNVQSSCLSLLAPKVSIYKGDGTLLASGAGSYNSTVTVSKSVSSGQNRFIKVEGAESTVFGTGKYALQVNFGSTALPAVSCPNTATAATGGGGFSSPIELGEAYEAADVVDTTTDSSVQTTIVSSSSDDDSVDQDGRKKNKHVDETLALVVATDSGASSAVAQGVWGGESSLTDNASEHVDELLAADLLDAVLPGLGFVGDLPVL